jgi:hypothetical protein
MWAKSTPPSSSKILRRRIAVDQLEELPGHRIGVDRRHVERLERAGNADVGRPAGLQVQVAPL